ncbi:ATP-binding protein [Leuconostoc carnosum]|uniref:ATP-binding protein n=1 Tax=Leuconostoc TaxID=1243 RepID=UPI0003164CC0|nr:MULTISPECIES: ATP-binding protein [Leuconostoc]KAA8324838.1 ATP-binding protein [Leuconostoc carnosum]KAA8358774.1 ATP-binding protein [Leuconostoc carnosum]KAA8364944.1 ATP-binding protein [Leuconostoc carnosum]KAA8366486.1 ATP-binding protein [Leuconostoc carnosum]KAA8371869.1 ATP-binding protein [Leuconostoc carnosum]
MSLSFQQLLTAVPLVLRGGNVPNIVGEAGIGKSALVSEIAHHMEARLFTTVVSLSEKGDLAIPIPPLTKDAFLTTKNYGQLADVKFGYTHTLIQIIQQAESFPKQTIIWFLDEFNRGSQAVQSELMNLVLQRQINDLILPDNVYLILAENPDDSMAGFENAEYAVQTSDAAINDRTTRLVMTVSVTDWLSWAEKPGNQRPHIHQLVRQFIAENAELLYPQTRGIDLNPTPRAWQRVSDNFYELSKLPSQQQDTLLFDIIAGDLGKAVATQFVSFVHEKVSGLTAKNIFDSEPKGPKLPQDIRQQFVRMSEIQKLTVMKTVLLTSNLTSNNHAGRFGELLHLLAPDGQYALIKQMTNSPILDDLYRADSHYANVLYQQIMDIATR